MSQAGLEPIRAGRFFVHTPTHRARSRRAINFEIDAGLAFGTGQHDTTAGCLAALDRLEAAGKRFANIADIGTGTGLLAFAALALWPEAKAIATDIDPIAIDVTADNARDQRRAASAMARANCCSRSPTAWTIEMLAARAPFDLLIANILAGPLIDSRPSFAASVAPGATVVLAGLLDTQADAVIARLSKRTAMRLDRTRRPANGAVLVPREAQDERLEAARLALGDHDLADTPPVSRCASGPPWFCASNNAASSASSSLSRPSFAAASKAFMVGP